MTSIIKIAGFMHMGIFKITCFAYHRVLIVNLKHVDGHMQHLSWQLFTFYITYNTVK
jgi:hypothetical protein